MQTIHIIDFGMGNLHSLNSRIKKLGYSTLVTNDVSEINKADKIILPGVGHFARGMENMRKQGLIEIINTAIIVERKPILGICLGMQLFTEYSEEGGAHGLGYISGTTIKLPSSESNIKIPHMGWNSIQFNQPCPLFKGISNSEMFYFLHSYFVKCSSKDRLAETEYGIKFTSALWKDNIYGVQFHPEKSHDAGMQILKNFCEC